MSKEYRREYLRKKPWVRSMQNAQTRCCCKTHDSYKNYGGRGIKFFLNVNDMEWLWGRDEAWLMNKPSIDRIDTNGDYTKKNCRFIEFSENVRRRNTKIGYKKAREIIRIHSLGERTRYELSKEYEVTYKQICRVIRGEVWGDK